ncbi:Protein BOP3 [Nakaseomyces bracarensis]|uniref:Protein BOP3 n=1 Tax=Nakaseomyces bracarensis TaxID=273131 RepID=A0ABR4NRC9_9SACH
MSESRSPERGHGRSKSLLDVIFGNSVTDWNMSETTLAKSLDFKIEQEKTKQQYYRLESINKTIELLKLASNANIPPQQITRLFGGEAGLEAQNKSSDMPIGNSVNEVRGTHSLSPEISSDSNTNINVNQNSSCNSLQGPPSAYKFPPVGSNLPPRPVPTHQRTNSPARIGANAVAVLDDAIKIKEEPESESMFERTSPLLRKAEPISNHNRNLSEPSSRYFTSSTTLNNITGPVTTVIDFEPSHRHTRSRNNLKYDPSTPDKGDSGIRSPRKTAMVTKRHRRTRSASSFGVIDLNIVDEAKRTALEKVSISKMNDDRKIRQAIKLDDVDERTCSESSSRTNSPTRIAQQNSVTRLLNNP